MTSKVGKVLPLNSYAGERRGVKAKSQRQVDREFAEQCFRIARANCHHFWLTEPPNGSTSKGVCKLCGEERVFGNSALRYEIYPTHPKEGHRS